jgi:hypothetical protein
MAGKACIELFKGGRWSQSGTHARRIGDRHAGDPQCLRSLHSLRRRIPSLRPCAMPLLRQMALSWNSMQVFNPLKEPSIEGRGKCKARSIQSPSRYFSEASRSRRCLPSLPQHVLRLAVTGGIPAIDLAPPSSRKRLWRFDPQSLQRWLREREQAGRPSKTARRSDRRRY